MAWGRKPLHNLADLIFYRLLQILPKQLHAHLGWRTCSFLFGASKRMFVVVCVDAFTYQSVDHCLESCEENLVCLLVCVYACVCVRGRERGRVNPWDCLLFYLLTLLSRHCMVTLQAKPSCWVTAQTTRYGTLGPNQVFQEPCRQGLLSSKARIYLIVSKTSNWK